MNTDTTITNDTRIEELNFSFEAYFGLLKNKISTVGQLKNAIKSKSIDRMAFLKNKYYLEVMNFYLH